MIHVFNDYESLSQAAAEMFVNLADQAIDSNGALRWKYATLAV